MTDFGENNIIENVIYHLGASSPYIVFMYALYILRNKYNLLSIFCVGFIINIIINSLLKAIIREPRPSYNKPEFNTDTDTDTDESAEKLDDPLGTTIPFNVYGMPSGHAQGTAYTFFYLFLVTKNIQIALIPLLLIIITGYQRVLSMNHTLLQVIVGTILGLLSGYIFYRYAENFFKPYHNIFFYFIYFIFLFYIIYF